MNIIIIITSIILAFFNALCYFLVWWNWRRDCKEIGKDMLAVSLSERFITLCIILSVPSAIGIIYVLTHA